MDDIGLISSEIIASDERTVTVREVWNVKHPDCPVLVLDITKWPFEKRQDAEVVAKHGELIERVAIRSAVANNGGEWATHFTEDQKNHWRKFAAELIADVTHLLE